MPYCSKTKIVVFDLDETLGYFSEFGMVCEAVSYYISKNNLENVSDNQELFNNLLDLFPEFLRPNIFSMLEYLKKKKKKSKCNKLILYTNNQGPTEWAKSIIKYFEIKINYKLFDQIIAAYKINGQQVEMCRTTYSKTHDDLLKCTKLESNTEICFLDDIYHPGMDNDNIYYINVKAYKHDLSFSEIIKRLIKSNIINISDEKQFKEEISKKLIRYHYTPRPKLDDEQEVDYIISKRIFHYLRDFFGDLKKNKTKKNNKSVKNKTIRLR
jgi:FMN phosphatase YigB (HAD superfamily)